MSNPLPPYTGVPPSAAPIPPGSLPTITLTGQVTGSASGGSIATTLTSANLPVITLTGQVTGLASGGSIATTLTAANLPTITLTGQVTGAASGGSIATTLTSANLPTITLTGAVTGAASGGSIATTLAAGSLPTITLTGDTTGSGSGGAITTTTVKVHGASIPAAGALTTGNAPYVSGASALTYSALNLAGGSGWVTGNLPIANVAPGTSGQFLQTNVGGATTWAVIAAASLPTITITGQVTGAASGGSIATTLTSANLPTIALTGNVTGSASGGSIATTVASVPAGALPSISLTGDVTGSGSGGAIATTTAKIQGNTVTAGALTKGQFLVATTTTNWAATSLSLDVSESAVTPGALTVTGLQGSALPSLAAGVLRYTGSAWALSSTLAVTTLAAGSNDQLLDTSHTGTVEWFTLSGDAAFASHALTVTQAQGGALTWTVTTGAQTWATTATPSLTQTSTTAAAPATMLVSPQKSTNVAANGSILQIDIGNNAGAGTVGGVQLTQAGSLVAQIGPYPAAPATVTAFWLGLAGDAITNSNFAFAGQKAGAGTYNSYFNAGGTGGNIWFSINSPSTQVQLGINTSGAQFFDGENYSLGGGAGVLGIAVATTLPSAAITNGVVLAVDSNAALRLYSGSTPTNFATLGETTGVGALWLGAAPGAIPINNACLYSDGTALTLVNGPGSSGAVELRVNNATATPLHADKNGIQLFSGTPDYGGGTGGILGITQFSAGPTSAPTASMALGYDGSALYAYGPSAYLADHGLTSPWQGTGGFSHAARSRQFRGTNRSVNSTPVTICTVDMSRVRSSGSNGTTMKLRVSIIGRDVQTTPPESLWLDQIVAFQLNSTYATLTQVGSATTVSSISNLGVGAVTYVISGTNLLIKGAMTDGRQADWTCEANVLYS